MEKIEIIQMTPAELQRMFVNLEESIVSRLKVEDKKPSEYEEITVAQAASELKCSVRTIQRRMKDLHITGHKIGKNVIIQRKDLKKIKLAS